MPASIPADPLTAGPITPELFAFLRDLKANNDRQWFAENRDRYLTDVRDPMLAFIRAFAVPLAEISPHCRADPRPNGTSLFRIYRDMRFSKDKTPYKTNIGAHFRHAAGTGAHAPGFYLHLEPGRCFAACGIWRPDGAALGAIRDAIVDQPQTWSRITTADAFRSTFAWRGESLKRPPRGYDPDHPLIEDLRRKDFLAGAELAESDTLQPGFFDHFVHLARTGFAFVEFLAGAVGAQSLHPAKPDRKRVP